jgi:stress response protein YsnF
MKSAYELAMERLEKNSPTARLTAAQKAEVGELESLYKAKKAEKELFLRGEIAKAEATGDAQAVEQLNQQLSHELRRLEEDLETKKEKVRKGA